MANVKSKISRFESFINDVLKQDLAKLSERLDQINTEACEFLQLRSYIVTLRASDDLRCNFKTQLDLGNRCYMEAKVEEPACIYLDIGLGHFVELTLEDALAVVEVRLKLFKRQTDNLRMEIAKTNAHVKLLLLGIRDLQGLETTT